MKNSPEIDESGHTLAVMNKKTWAITVAAVTVFLVGLGFAVVESAEVGERQRCVELSTIYNKPGAVADETRNELIAWFARRSDVKQSDLIRAVLATETPLSDRGKEFRETIEPAYDYCVYRSVDITN